MSTAEIDRGNALRAALHRALRKGDVLGAARAWDHLRVRGVPLTPEDAEAGRAARHIVGRAIRQARFRREGTEERWGLPVRGQIARTARVRAFVAERWRRLLLAGAGVVVGLLIALFVMTPWGGQSEPAAGAPAAQPVASAATGAGRGRVTATEAPVVRAPATPAPQTTSAPAVSGNPGAGAGTGSGLFPGPLAPTDDRFLFVVRDAQTLQVLQGVCVTYGNECRADRTTNVNGTWWVDFPKQGAVARPFDFLFQKQGYSAFVQRVDYTPGFHEFEILLKRSTP